MGSGIRRCRTRCCTSRRGPTETRSARNHRYQWGRSGRLEEIIRTERIQSFSTHWSYLPAVCLSESRDEDITQPAGRARLAAVGVFRKLSRALESEELSRPVDQDLYATMTSASSSVGRSTSLPLQNVAPARTSGTRCGALTARQRP